MVRARRPFPPSTCDGVRRRRLRGDGVWARLRQRRGSRAVKGIVEQESGLGHELLRNAISVWTPKFAPCFRIIREEGKYKRLRNADKFQARVSKIRKALAETSTRPVTFHEEVCLGEEVESV